MSGLQALRTHKRYCQTRIMAVATKLLEQCKVELQERREKRVKLGNVEEEPKIEENSEVPGNEIPYWTSEIEVPKYHIKYLWVKVYLSTVSNHLVQLARAYSKSHTCNTSIWKAEPQDMPSETISRQTSSPTTLHTSTSTCGYYQWPTIPSPKCWRCTTIPFSATTSRISHTS